MGGLCYHWETNKMVWQDLCINELLPLHELNSKPSNYQLSHCVCGTVGGPPYCLVHNLQQSHHGVWNNGRTILSSSHLTLLWVWFVEISSQESSDSLRNIEFWPEQLGIIGHESNHERKKRDLERWDSVACHSERRACPICKRGNAKGEKTWALQPNFMALIW